MFKRSNSPKLIAFLCILSLIFTLVGCLAGPKSKSTKFPTKTQPANELVLATTTSVNDSGLMGRLKPLFEEKYNAKLKIISVGTGQALEQARRGNADVVLTHDKEAEEKFIQQGYGVKRNIVMANYFILVGPKNDPAKIKGKKPLEAMKKIAAAKAPFVSRSDKSGTYKREQELWEKANVKPEGDWYIQSGSGQGPTLLLANEKGAYTLTDKATYLYLKKKKRLPKLDILVDTADQNMLNVYSVILVNPEKVRGTNTSLARKFVSFMVNQNTQKIIGDFGKKEVNEKLFISRNRMTQAQRQ